jgi:hypothetical protein
LVRNLKLKEMNLKPITHGTNTGYRRKCRCELCKKAHSEGNKKYRNGERREKKTPKKSLRQSINEEPDYKFVVHSKV